MNTVNEVKPGNCVCGFPVVRCKVGNGHDPECPAFTDTWGGLKGGADKMSKLNKAARPTFTAVDMLKQARGLPTPEGYAVITKQFAEKLEAELIRLYEVEEAAVNLCREVENTKKTITPQSDVFLTLYDLIL